MKPVKVKALHQIEITSRCNLACKYCVHKRMPRPKQDMEHETFIKCLEVAGRFVRAGTQKELNLAGIGESSMHERFSEYVFMARAAVGNDCHIVLSTNGVSIKQDHVDALKECGVSVYVSPHRPEKAAHAINMLREAGMFRGVSDGAFMGSVDWAGQVKWPVTAPTTGSACPWLNFGRVTIFSDGRASTCCFDSDGSGVVGTIDQLLAGEDLYVLPYRLCGPCHHEVPK